MNLLIRNINDLNSPFYDLKDCLTNYFLAIAGGEKPKIVKFYGANVNPEILKGSLNQLFFLLLEKYHLTLENPLQVNDIIQNDKIYKIIKKMYQFYNILVRHDVQTNYLHSFMERKIKNLEGKSFTLKELLKKNILFFYFASKVYSNINFSIEEDKFSVCEILKPENKVKIYPLFVDLIKNGTVKLSDLLDHINNPKDNNIGNINEKISLLL